MGDSLDPLREYERKFLVADASILKGSRGDEIRQGYLWRCEGWALRVRLLRTRDDDGEWRESEASLTLKGPRVGLARPEVETPVAFTEAERLMLNAEAVVLKERHQPIVSEGRAWVIDVFQGANEGLMLAEYEGSRADVERMRPPWWCGTEVTFDSAYANENLAK